ncbi:MAG: polysaccharide biosynthesis protein [Lachnospiraceae bacterium]|nr:polysaccharide biosynthesis protein [Lachnospiraceae bacterium]
MTKQIKKDGFIMQAGILAVAGILSRIIGLLYNSPMTAIIGDEGNGYYAFAYRAYTIVLLISSYSIPSAISKVVAGHLAGGEYKNAHRIFKGAMLYVIFVGGSASLLVFFFADKLLSLAGAATVLKFFAPTIFLSGILGVLRGYFQAHRTMAQTSVSQILEQILNALVSILLAIWLTGLMPFNIAGAEEATRRSVNGAIGGALGTGFGVLTGIIFMWAIYYLNKKTIKRRIEQDKHPEELSYQAIFKMILFVVTPFILSTCIYNINSFINATIFSSVMAAKEVSVSEIAVLMSAVEKSTKISNIPIALAAAMSAALIPGIAGDFAVKRLDLCRDKVAKAIRSTMFIAIPAAMGILALSKPVMLLLYPQRETLDLSANLLIIMAAGVVFYSLSTLSSAVLQGTGRVNSPVVNAAIALVLQTVVLDLVLFYTDFSTYAMAVAPLLFAFLMCLLNALSVRRHLEYRQEWDRTFFRPLLISIVMAALAFGTYHGFYFLLKMNLPALIIAVLVGALVYFVLVVKFKVVSEAEIKWLPHSKQLTELVGKIGAKRERKNKHGHGQGHEHEHGQEQEQKQAKDQKESAASGDKNDFEFDFLDEE